MKRVVLLFALFGLFAACGSDDNSPEPVDDFDRKAMLTNWADNIIVPGLEANVNKLAQLVATAEAFRTNPAEAEFQALKTAWIDAYKAWQRIGMFEIGKAEELQLISRMNLYPTDVDGIEENIAAGTYNLDLPSEKTRQGFPALDYLLYGIGADETAVLAKFQDGTNGEAYREYVLDVAEKMQGLLQQVLADWNSGYRETFVNNDGNNATASTDRLVNDYIFYYEKHLRAGKVGIPAGVFSGAELPENVEGRYSRVYSRDLLAISLDATEDFFLGRSYDGSTSGPGLNTYLVELGTTKNGMPLGDLIVDQWAVALSEIQALDTDFFTQVNTDNIAMLRAYDALQINVVNLKVDMLQALNINVDYVDADGD